MKHLTIILDFDGTLFNTIGLHMSMFRATARKQNILEICKSYVAENYDTFARQAFEWQKVFATQKEKVDWHLISESQESILKIFTYSFNLSSFSSIVGGALHYDSIRLNEIKRIDQLSNKLNTKIWLISDSPKDQLYKLPKLELKDSSNFFGNNSDHLKKNLLMLRNDINAYFIHN